MKFEKCFFVFCIGLLITNIVGAVDLKLQPYPNARELNHSSKVESQYLLALGSYKKIDGAWLVDRSQRLNGELERITLELPADYNAENGFLFYKEQLEKYNLRELFYCKARDCGTSNSWANNHFKIVQLYGLDQHQFYGAYEITNAAEKPFYVALYAIARGNKRVYVQLDILHIDKVDDFGVASSPETLNKLLNMNGYYVFPDFAEKNSQGDVSFQVKKAHIQALASLLKAEVNIKIALVGHNYSQITLAQQQQKSNQYAEQIKAALVDQGVDTKRMQTFGVGSLAPAGRGDRSARVEVVKLDEKL